MRKFIVLDTETTGLQPDFDELLELAIIDQDGAILFHEKFRPELAKSWPEAEAIHHIAPTDVAGAKPYGHYRKDVQKIIAGSPLIVGYNLLFDLRFLDVEIPFNAECYDVMEAFATVYGVRRQGGYAYQRLEVCARYYGYDFRPHSALEDARATLHCYRCMKGLE